LALEIIDLDSLLDLPLLAELGVEIDLALTGDKSGHVLLHEWLLNDLDDPGSCFLILDQKHVYQIFHPLAVGVRNRLLLVLHNLKNQAKKVLRVKGVF
jgi:hypothetical protein